MLVRPVCGATLAQAFDHYKECTDDEDGLHRAWLEGNRSSNDFICFIPGEERMLRRRNVQDSKKQKDPPRLWQSRNLKASRPTKTVLVSLHIVR